VKSDQFGIFRSAVSNIAQNLPREDGIVRTLSGVLGEKTSLFFPASHARYIPILLILNPTFRSEVEIENADSLEEAQIPKGVGGL